MNIEEFEKLFHQEQVERLRKELDISNLVWKGDINNLKGKTKMKCKNCQKEFDLIIDTKIFCSKLCRSRYNSRKSMRKKKGIEVMVVDGKELIVKKIK